VATTQPGGTDLQTKDFFASTLLSTCIALMVALAILHFAPISEIVFSHFQYVPTRDIKELDSYEQIVIERMIREKSLITVDTLWSLQVSFYQTMISVLIALNAVIVGGAFVVIRSSSKAEVVRESKAHFEEFSKAGEFTKIIEKKAKKEIQKLNATYGDMFDELYAHDKRITTSEDAIIQVSSRLAELDKSENCAADDGKITE
jgi:methyl-accepting chemotaxis protein